MEIIREQIQKPVTTGIVGLVVGLVIGWFIIGWGLWPVEWTDAAPRDLHEVWKEDYLRMAIDSYTLRPDPELAQQRWNDLEPGAAYILAQIEVDPGVQGVGAVESFRSVVVAQVEESPLPPEESGKSSTNAFLAMCLITLVLGAALAGYFLLRRGQPKVLSPAAEAQKVTSQMQVERSTDFEAQEGTPPIAQFMTTYMLGDDLFDDSFSIDAPTGEFLGECGVGISETVGVGEPKKVTAFEVWLFDKNDIQTVTKVLMSQHAFADTGLRSRLAAKGDPFLVEPGGETMLETATLRMVARVVDMSYGAGASPANSYFEQLTLELAIWHKV